MSSVRIPDDEFMSQLNRVVRHMRIHGLWESSTGDGAVSETSRPILFRNDSGETIPAYGCMYVTGAEELNGQNYLIADKPDADSFYGDSSRFLLNGSNPVDENEQGAAQSGPILHAFKDSSDTDDPDAGTHWIPVSGQWYLERSDGAIFTAMGEDDVAEDVFKVRVNDVKEWAGKFASAVSSGSTSGDFVIWRAGVATSTTFTGIRNDWSASVPADTDKICTVRLDATTGKLNYPIEDC